MKNYEMMFIVKATMESDLVKKAADTMQEIVTSAKSNVVEFKELGEKKLAYAINKETNGYNFVMKIAATKEVIAELDRRASLDETILRHLIIKLDEE